MRNEYYVVGNIWLATAMLAPSGKRELASLVLAIVSFGVGIITHLIMNRRDWRDLG